MDGAVTVNGGSGWSRCNINGGERGPCGNLCRCLRAVDGALSVKWPRVQ